MTRDLARLASEEFDLLIVGGGIYGLAAALDAAVRGLRTALVERGDFGSGASFNHHKTLHGGLRYLQTLDLRRMRESIAERRVFPRIAPALIAPQAFAMPTRGALARSRLALQAAFALDALVAADRNAGVPASHRLPRGRVIGRRALERLAPDLVREGVTGAGLWYDYITTDNDRLTLSFGLAAARNGAALANYADAIAPLRDGTRVTGMRVRDLVSTETVDVRARMVLNAAGAAAGRVMAAFGVARPRIPLVKAMNVVTSRPAPSVAMGAPTSEGRLLFALPWRGRLVVGTSHGRELAGPDDVLARAAEVDAFLREIDSAFPAFELTRDDVTLVHRGVVPAADGGGPPRLRDRPGIRDHERDGIPGAVSVLGVKYTTARRVSAAAVTLIARKLGKSLPPARIVPVHTPATHAVEGLGAASAELARLYDDEACARMAEAVSADGALGRPVADGAGVIGAQILEAIRHEGALTLEDIVVRRTGLGAAGHPGDAAVQGCARVAAGELGWSSARCAEEITAVGAFYELA